MGSQRVSYPRLRSIPLLLASLAAAAALLSACQSGSSGSTAPESAPPAAAATTKPDGPDPKEQKARLRLGCADNGTSASLVMKLRRAPGSPSNGPYTVQATPKLSRHSWEAGSWKLSNGKGTVLGSGSVGAGKSFFNGPTDIPKLVGVTIAPHTKLVLLWTNRDGESCTAGPKEFKP